MKPLNAGEPAQVGRYRVFAVLGEGGMGRVLLGRSPDGRLVALKQVHPGFAHDPDFRERFRREVATSRMVSGAYTAAVMDADPDAPTPWLASVFVPGPSLSEAIAAGGPLPPQSLRHLAAGLALALGEIHRAGLVHRDLKPSNVILTHDGPRVIDFGIARAAEGDSELTHTGSIIGSPGFMSPEQAEGKPLSPASDLFSFGALMVMAATGQGPFTGTSTPHTLYNVVHTQPDLRLLAPELRQIVEPCLAKDPANRPAPAWVLHQLGPIAPVASPWPPLVPQRIEAQQREVRDLLNPPPPKRSRRGLYAGLAAAAVALLVGGTIAVVNLTRPDAPPAAAPSAPEVAAPITTPVNPDPLGPDNLRRIDLCKPLDGQEVTGTGKLVKTSETDLSACSYENPAGGTLGLEVGTPPPSSTPAGEVEGLPVTTYGDCSASVAVNGMPGLVLTAQVYGITGDPCATAKSALGTTVKRIRAGGMEHGRPANSLAYLDPCTLFPPAAEATLGTLIAREPRGLHQCEYGTQGLVDVRLVRGYPPEETAGRDTTPVDLGGTRAFVTRVHSSANSATCSATWTHRSVDDRVKENVQLEYSSTGWDLTLDQVCEKTQQIASVLSQNLPKP